jgi:hypothetical protein
MAPDIRVKLPSIATAKFGVLDTVELSLVKFAAHAVMFCGLADSAVPIRHCVTPKNQEHCVN